MPWSVGVGGSYKAVQNVWVGVGGAWKKVAQISVGVGAAWKPSLATITVSGGAIEDSDVGGDGVANAALTIRADGTVDSLTDIGGTAQISPSTDWIRPISAATGTYEVRATLQSGTTPTGTLDTWLALSSDRSWSIQQSGAGTATAQLLIEIRTGGVVLDSGVYTLEAAVV